MRIIFNDKLRTRIMHLIRFVSPFLIHSFTPLTTNFLPIIIIIDIINLAFELVPSFSTTQPYFMSTTTNRSLLEEQSSEYRQCEAQLGGSTGAFGVRMSSVGNSFRFNNRKKDSFVLRKDSVQLPGIP